MTILFDLDGTLIDSTEAVCEGFGVAFRAHGQALPTDAAISGLIGYPLEEMFAHLGTPEALIASHVAAYKAHYKTIAHLKTRLLPQTQEALQIASGFASLGVVTTKASLSSWELLKHFGLDRFFGVVIGREDVKNPKPHPEPILAALNRMGAEPMGSWMIGDTPLDILAAEGAGIGGVAVLGGYASRELLQRHTKNLAENLLDAVYGIKSNIFLHPHR